MATAASLAMINFTFPWKIYWDQFRELSTKKIEKIFTTSYNNVVYYWSVGMGVYVGTPADKFGFVVRYQDGPLAVVENMNYKISFISDNPDSKRPSWSLANRDYDCRQTNSSWGWADMDIKDVDAFRQKYGFRKSSPLICQITLQIPTTAFSFLNEQPFRLFRRLATVPPKWVSDLFQCIDDQEKSPFFNAKIVSRTGRIFFCHKVVLDLQSPALAAMFRHPPGPNQEKDTYPFPTMGDVSLKAFLEYLYTGRVTLIENITTPSVIETADAAELYGLQSLKDLCHIVLWNRAVARPGSCFKIVRFADLHADFKCVKHRAFDVLAENYMQLNLNGALALLQAFGGDQHAEQLVAEFNEYLVQRVQGCFTVQ